jgi:phospholipid transport system transporter-binding protein
VSEPTAEADASTGAFTASDDRSHWSFDGALTFDNAASVLEAAGALDLPSTGRIDLSGLRSVDSAALAVLFALQRRAKASRRKLVFEGIPPGLLSLARVYDVETLL